MTVGRMPMRCGICIRLDLLLWSICRYNSQYHRAVSAHSERLTTCIVRKLTQCTVNTACIVFCIVSTLSTVSVVSTTNMLAQFA